MTIYLISDDATTFEQLECVHNDLLRWVVYVIECLVAVFRHWSLLNLIITGLCIPVSILLRTCLF